MQDTGKRRYTIEPRKPDAWKLRFWLNDEEVGGGVFPVCMEGTDLEVHKALSEAYAEAQDEGESWLAESEEDPPEPGSEGVLR